VLERADHSLRFDLDTKLKPHQAAGIPDYWVVDGRQPAAFFCCSRNSPQLCGSNCISGSRR